MTVSVVIPTYRRPDLLPRAITSVLNQTYQDIEINIVSDGFHKETDEVMLQYEKNPKIKYYSYPENKGGNYARNYGIKQSTGEYIAFLDDDDLWDTEKISKQMEVVKKDNVGLVYTGKKHIFKNENLEFETGAKLTGDLSDKIFERNFIGSTSCVLAERKFIEEAGYFDEDLPSLQDFDLWIRICQLTNVGAVDEPLLIYINENANDQVSANINKRIKALELIVDKYRSHLEGKEDELDKLEKYIIETILKIAQRNSDKESLKKYRKKYLNKNKDLKSIIFAVATSIPHDLLLKVRSLLN